MNHKGTVKLETGRLILRRFTHDDAGNMFHNWANDPEVSKYMTWQPHGDVLVTKNFLGLRVPCYEKPDYYDWAVETKEGGVLIGSIGAGRSRDDIRMVHIGYCIGRPWWHRGYTSEALAELIRFFFDEVGVNRIESAHDPQNQNSGGVMIKCGMQYEGTLRQTIPRGNVLGDAKYYAILEEDYRKR